jgi:flagellar hook-basal body complex protein FliE
MIMMEKADISFRLMTQVRNKIMQAYEEIMRMQV